MRGMNIFTIRRRTTILFLLIMGLMGILVGRLLFIQVIRADYYQRLAENQRLREVPIEAKRGVIYDRNLRPLAVSFDTDCVYALPAQVEDPSRAAELLAETLNIPTSKLYPLLIKNSSFVWLKRKALPEEVEATKKLRLPGIEVAQKAQRYYPSGALAADLIGIAGIDNQGLEGLEKEYDIYLRGAPGSEQAEFDSKGDHIPLGERRFIPAHDGHDLILTIDDHIQHIVERELEKVILEQEAKHGSVIVMDPKTGEVLALANYPGFNPNDYFNYPLENRRNWALTDQQEPGSTFKIVTSMAALEEGVVRPDSVFFDPGFLIVEDRTIHCWRAGGHGSQTFVEAVENSCNPVFSTIALRLGKEKFYQYLEAFGFGEKTGIDFPGEAQGILRNISKIKNVELATIGFGQGISVTPIQLLRALCVAANGGYLVEPRLVKEITSLEGETVKRFEPKVIRRVISEKTAKEINEILQSVVANGSGNRAQIIGYKVAGKTGTAEKPLRGAYGQERIASFLGFAPADNPRVAVIVILDEPKGPIKYGGVIAAPVFATIVRDTLHYLGIQPQMAPTEERSESAEAFRIVPNLLRLTREEVKKALETSSFGRREFGKGQYVMEQNPKAGVLAPPRTTILLYYDEAGKYNKDESMVLVPDLTGLSVEKVIEILKDLGLTLSINGEGLAVEQIPSSGTRLSPGMQVTVYFAPIKTKE